jgi:hypothetical protein
MTTQETHRLVGGMSGALHAWADCSCGALAEAATLREARALLSCTGIGKAPGLESQGPENTQTHRQIGTEMLKPIVLSTTTTPEALWADETACQGLTTNEPQALAYSHLASVAAVDDAVSVSLEQDFELDFADTVIHPVSVRVHGVDDYVTTMGGFSIDTARRLGRALIEAAARLEAIQAGVEE